MRAIRDAQLRLEFYKSESKLSKKLGKISEIFSVVRLGFCIVN